MFKLLSYYTLLIFCYGKRTLAERPEFLFLFLLPYVFVKGSILLLFGYDYGAAIYTILGVMIIFWKPSKTSNFLKTVFSSKRYWTIFLFERFLRILPFVILLIYNGFWEYTLVFIPAILITPIQWSRSKNIVIPTPFRKHQWEYISAFRHPFVLIILGGLVFFVFKSIQWKDTEMLLSTIVLIGFVFTSLPSVMDELPFYIWIYSLNSRKFHRKKMRESLIVLFFLIPFLGLYAYLNTEQEAWYAFLTILCFVQISTAQILLKYTTIYGNKMDYSFVFVGFLIVTAKYTDYLYLYPVGILYIYFLYTKANKNIYPILK